MKLLILTQKVDENDDVLGFMHGWINEFAKNCERVTVVCLEMGKYNLPPNVSVMSLGKEDGRSHLKYVFNFFKYIWLERKNYNAVFVHMNPEYIILGGWMWRLLGKRIGLWYAHGFVPFQLRIAEKFTDSIFTSTKSGCRLKSNKIKVVGQGIDTDKFSLRPNMKGNVNEPFRIITVGRISPVKDYETLIAALFELKKNGANITVDIIGGAGKSDQESYLKRLREIVKDKGLDKIVNFHGPIANNKIISHLRSADLFVNTSLTGSLDKAILEAMSTGLPILTCNEALREVLGQLTSSLMFAKGDHTKLAEKIEEVIDMSPDERSVLGASLREIVVRDHSLQRFVEKILTTI